jgi:hypothetical protein
MHELQVRWVFESIERLQCTPIQTRVDVAETALTTAHHIPPATPKGIAVTRSGGDPDEKGHVIGAAQVTAAILNTNFRKHACLIVEAT